MKVLLYRGLHPEAIPGFEKLVGYLAADDFRSADVKKVGVNLYRARLDRSNRLLFSLYRHAGERCALLLEYIPQHAYEKSRFLTRGVSIDEERIEPADVAVADEAPGLGYLNPAVQRFHLLDKVLSFDDDQEAVYRQPPPLVIIGSAGSGKTALTLEKMKDAMGDVLYVTRSPFLAQNARDLYYAHGYANDEQQVDFLSFRDFLESIHVPQGREITPRVFAEWAGRQRLPREIRDSHQLFEEFQGAITGSAGEQPWLDRAAYLALGVRQSIYPSNLREAVYDLFEKYIRFLDEQDWFDANIVSHAWLRRVEPRYDFVVVDEVQDLTNVQLLLVLRTLRDPRSFLLCGDSNQIVHPNFFSWSKVKSLFWREQGDEAPADLIRILNANFRNSPQVTELANRLLRIKHARFGSIDRESNYLVRSCGPAEGRVVLLKDSEGVKAELDRRTASSARFAILVMHPEQKAEVRRHFRTPLVFSIHEAKGLEYESVLLYGFVCSEEKRFRDIATGLDEASLTGELSYARGRDKGDKSLEIYKFYINALYVAVTRAVKNLYLLEPQPHQPILNLLGLGQIYEDVEGMDEQSSSMEEWRHEARRLELQGKDEQAAEIRSQILKEQRVPWTVLRGDVLAELEHKALAAREKKAGIALMEYALVYRDQRRLNALEQAGVKAVKNPTKALDLIEKKYFMPFGLKSPAIVLRDTERYGVDFRNVFGQTPLMIASHMGNVELAEMLLDRGADTALVDGNGLNAFQIALDRACADKRFARSRLPPVFERLAPASLDGQVDGRLIKLDRNHMEYLMLCLSMVLFYQRLGANWAHRRMLLTAADFEEVLAGFHDAVVPQRRKRRQYLSSILAKNEVERDDPYNRKLFKRVRRGSYVLNPGLALRIEGRWQRIYQVLSPERLGVALEDDSTWAHYGWSANTFFQRAIDELRDMLRSFDEDEASRAEAGAPHVAGPAG